MVEQGEVRPGMRCLDEASAAALGGEYEEDFPVCWTCCYLIYACERVRDYERAAQWCRKVEEYSERRGIRWVRHVCRAHYAAVLTWRGEFAEAERVLLETQRALEATRPVWASEATVRLADLRRRQGRWDEAERLFAASEPHLLAVLGRGELCLDRGRPAEAVGFAERLLRQLPDSNLTQRAGALELLVRARASRDDLEALRPIVAAIGGDPLRAALRRCEGVVARAEGDFAGARAAFEDAVALYERCAAPFEAARSRRELAAAGRAERARSRGAGPGRPRPDRPRDRATSSSSAVTPCTGTSRTSTPSSAARRAPRPWRGRPSSARSAEPQSAAAAAAIVRRRRAQAIFANGLSRRWRPGRGLAALAA